MSERPWGGPALPQTPDGYQNLEEYDDGGDEVDGADFLRAVNGVVEAAHTDGLHDIDAFLTHNHGLEATFESVLEMTKPGSAALCRPQFDHQLDGYLKIIEVNNRHAMPAVRASSTNKSADKGKGKAIDMDGDREMVSVWHPITAYLDSPSGTPPLPTCPICYREIQVHGIPVSAFHDLGPAVPGVVLPCAHIFCDECMNTHLVMTLNPGGTIRGIWGSFELVDDDEYIEELGLEIPDDIQDLLSTGILRASDADRIISHLENSARGNRPSTAAGTHASERGLNPRTAPAPNGAASSSSTAPRPSNRATSTNLLPPLRAPRAPPAHMNNELVAISLRSRPTQRQEGREAVSMHSSEYSRRMQMVRNRLRSRLQRELDPRTVPNLNEVASRSSTAHGPSNQATVLDTLAPWLHPQASPANMIGEVSIAPLLPPPPQLQEGWEEALRESLPSYLHRLQLMQDHLHSRAPSLPSPAQRQERVELSMDEYVRQRHNRAAVSRDQWASRARASCPTCRYILAFRECQHSMRGVPVSLPRLQPELEACMRVPETQMGGVGVVVPGVCDACAFARAMEITGHYARKEKGMGMVNRVIRGKLVAHVACQWGRDEAKRSSWGRWMWLPELQE
ncbi:hypothetical protein B0H67DRAFT_647264 [Lasiosphaeris hirsuta]|uniref:RING-type domain-containing protein n=1 Tax=Lasiosphaeris hirsuta TaxID=260670 RepID=A0AA40A9V7_9PEZI|nr:hypothetical protein B0H67DRAFT_647264 [Lasiosphaeris hirsuta]